MRYRDATERSTNQTLACTQTCIFRVENVCNAWVHYQQILSNAIHHTSNVNLLQEKVKRCCDLLKQRTFPFLLLCPPYAELGHITTLSKQLICAPNPQISTSHGFTDHIWLDQKLTDIVWPTKILLLSIPDHRVLQQRWRDNASHALNICTNTHKESSGRSVGSAAIY
jgi:hypothetical protein